MAAASHPLWPGRGDLGRRDLFHFAVRIQRADNVGDVGLQDQAAHDQLVQDVVHLRESEPRRLDARQQQP